MSFSFKLDKNKSLQYKLDKAISNRSMLNDLAEFMVTRIYTNTKRGYYAGIRKNLAKFRPLSKGYIESRQADLKGEIKSSGKTLLGGKRSRKSARKKALKKFGDFFDPKKSNLTYTGEMLDALDSSIDTSAPSVKAYVKSTSRSDDSGLSNLEVAVKVAEDGRPFLGIDAKGINTMTRIVIAYLRRSLRRS